MKLSFAAAVVNLLSGGTLESAQLRYTECLELQAPREVCLERFLLPKED